MPDRVFVEFIHGSLAIAHDHLPDDVSRERIIEMSMPQARLLGAIRCPTCRERRSV